MNLKLKRFALPAVAFGALTVPAAITLACGSVIPAKTPDLATKAFDGSDTTIGNILDNIKSKEVTPVSTNLMNEVKTLTGQTLYEEEFAASKLLQQQYFAYNQIDLTDRKWEVAKLVLAEKGTVSTAVTNDEKLADIKNAVEIVEKAENAANTSLQANRKSLDDYKRQEDLLTARITALDNDVKNVTPLNYESTSFTSDYPQIITPLQRIRDNQRRIYNEAKAAFINRYSTSSEGEANWVIQRASNYSNAKTDDEAVNVLISNNISTIAFGRFTYSINSAFSVKQVLSGAFKQFKQVDGKYVFGASGQGYFTKEESNRDGKVYFLGRNTKVVENIVVNPTDLTVGANKNALDRFTSRNVIGVQHALVKVTAGTGDTLPWVVNKTTIKHLLASYGTDVSKLSFDLYKNMFLAGADEEAKRLQDNTFFDSYSDNEDTTKKKNGSLGIDTMSYWVETMDIGFGMGIVAARSQKLNPTKYTAEELGYSANKGGQTFLNQLQTQLNSTLQNLNLAGIADPILRNRIIDQYVDNLSDADFQQRYGSIYRDLFSQSKMIAYEIDAAQNIYLVRSNGFGFHTIKINEYGNAEVLKNEIDRDLALIASKNDVSQAFVQWANIFSKIYTNQAIVSELVNDAALMAKVKLNSTSDFKAANPEKLAEWISNNYLKEGEDILERVRTTIANLDRNDVINAATKALTSKTVITSIIDSLDKRFLNPTINPERLYNAALGEMGVL